MLLWCQQQDESCLASVKDELTKNGFENYLRFQSPVTFARWLFSQKRGAVRPWSVLLVHWRDAKPCSSAVAAARSGCLKHLGHLPADAQRPNLPALTVSKEHVQASSLQPVNTAVSAMIIIVSQGKQEGRARLWVSNMQAATKKALAGSTHSAQTHSEHWWADGFSFSSQATHGPSRHPYSNANRSSRSHRQKTFGVPTTTCGQHLWNTSAHGNPMTLLYQT